MSKQQIDETQEYNKCRLCDDRDKTTNHMISEYRKLTLKELKKNKYDWLGKDDPLGFVL